MSFQENLRYYRERAGYKQAKEFAKTLDISYTTYTSYENQGREPKYNTLCKIADLLNVSIDELLGRKNNILGMNEDERLKKEINEILLSSNDKFLRLVAINKDDIIFSIYDDNDKFIQNTYAPKKDFINRINSLKTSIKKEINEKIYNNILFNEVNTAIGSLDLDFDKNNKLSEYEFRKTLISRIITLRKLQSIKVKASAKLSKHIKRPKSNTDLDTNIEEVKQSSEILKQFMQDNIEIVKEVIQEDNE